MIDSDGNRITEDAYGIAESFLEEVAAETGPGRVACAQVQALLAVADVIGKAAQLDRGNLDGRVGWYTQDEWNECERENRKERVRREGRDRNGGPDETDGDGP